MRLSSTIDRQRHVSPEEPAKETFRHHLAPEAALRYVSEGKSFREMPGVRLLTMQRPDTTA